MHTYDDHCDFTLQHLWDDMDHYFVVHWCNWFLASLVIRDAYILHFWSVFDEFLELSWYFISFIKNIFLGNTFFLISENAGGIIS